MNKKYAKYSLMIKIYMFCILKRLNMYVYVKQRLYPRVNYPEKYVKITKYNHINSCVKNPIKHHTIISWNFCSLPYGNKNENSRQIYIPDC